jgi:broad specificity phosphatase PhoE
VSRTVTFIRHAETEANAAVRWQGRSNSPMSARGTAQVSRLGKRFSNNPPGRLVASDLGRTMTTAQAIGDPQPDPRWREFSVGSWEGLTSEQVRQQFPGQLEALFAGEDISVGGGERMSVFRERVLTAFANLAESLDDGEDVTVVTHGGVIMAITRDVLGLETSSAGVIPPHNTSVTRVTIADDGGRQLTVFNDASHLDYTPTQFGPEGTVVSLFRHGQTEGNVAGRWQGRSDSPLTDLGRWQLEAARAYVPAVDVLYTSPLGRTVASAAVLAAHHDFDAVPHDGFVEMSFGSWENLTTAEAAEADPDLFDAIYVQGVDEPRGGDGESFTEAGARMNSALAVLAGESAGGSIGVVSHGAVIRAVVAAVAGIDFVDRNRIPVPRNSSMSRLVYSAGSVSLAGYNVAPHLD